MTAGLESLPPAILAGLLDALRGHGMRCGRIATEGPKAARGGQLWQIQVDVEEGEEGEERTIQCEVFVAQAGGGMPN